MSFGWSAGDIMAAANLLWSMYKALNEASGAPEQFRKSASTLKSIQFRLRSLSKVAGGDKNPNLLTETEEESLLEKEDKDDIRYIVVALKLAVGKLEVLVAKGCDMNLHPDVKKRRRDWPMYQINKLSWYIGKETEVNGLIQHILELTAPLQDLDSKISTALAKQRVVAAGEYHQTQLIYLKAILEKVTQIQKHPLELQLLQLDEEEKKARVPLLHAGPELGVPAAGADPGLNTDSTLAHLTSIAHDIISPGLQIKMNNLRADHHLKYKFTDWLSGKTSPRLWLYGAQAGTVSAIIYTVALDRKRPIIAYAGRHAAAGQMLTDQDRLLGLVYSLLFQLLLQFEDDANFAVTGVDEPFTDLRLSMESVPLALKYMRYFLGLLPECVCIVDRWNFISNDIGPPVEKALKDFLDLFGKPSVGAANDDWGMRLLLGSSGNSQMLRDLDKAYVDSFNVKDHVGVGVMKLRTTLLGIEW